VVGSFGIPTLKLREDYLAIVTIGFAEIIRFFLLNEEWLTRGPVGLHVFSRPFEDFVLGDYNYFLLLFVLIILAVCFLLLEKLIKSPWGRVFKAIREDEDVPTSLGKNVFSYKNQSLVLGSTIAGLAGALLAFYLQYINPRNFMPIETFYAWLCWAAVVTTKAPFWVPLSSGASSVELGSYPSIRPKWARLGYYLSACY
jgi:ABC-type branched-subunit amino acid transport system permease subunit